MFPALDRNNSSMALVLNMNPVAKTKQMIAKTSANGEARPRKEGGRIMATSSVELRTMSKSNHTSLADKVEYRCPRDLPRLTGATKNKNKQSSKSVDRRVESRLKLKKK